MVSATFLVKKKQWNQKSPHLGKGLASLMLGKGPVPGISFPLATGKMGTSPQPLEVIPAKCEGKVTLQGEYCKLPKQVIAMEGGIQ